LLAFTCHEVQLPSLLSIIACLHLSRGSITLASVVFAFLTFAIKHSLIIPFFLRSFVPSLTLLYLTRRVVASGFALEQSQRGREKQTLTLYPFLSSLLTYLILVDELLRAVSHSNSRSVGVKRRILDYLRDASPGSHCSLLKDAGM
jgi:hypothetical protein